MRIGDLEEALKIGGEADFTKKELIQDCEKYLKGSMSTFDSFESGQTLAVILTSNTRPLSNLKAKLSKVNFRANEDWEKELVKAVLSELESID